MALRHGFRCAGDGRDRLVSVERDDRQGIFFADLLAAFARAIGAGHERIIVLALENAGWHGPARLDIPDGIPAYLPPPYSPELQRAEHLWPLIMSPSQTSISKHSMLSTLSLLNAAPLSNVRSSRQPPPSTGGHNQLLRTNHPDLVSIIELSARAICAKLARKPEEAVMLQTASRRLRESVDAG
jgi:transposase